MKTTLELPDELMRRIKLRAVHRNQKLKDAVAQLLEAGIATLPSAEPPARATTGAAEKTRSADDRRYRGSDSRRSRLAGFSAWSSSIRMSSPTC